MKRLDIKEIINNAKDELERAYELLKDNEDAINSMLVSDIESSLERMEDLSERIDYAMLMSACVGDVAIPTVYGIYELEVENELPYEDGLVDTETVYNTIDDIVADLKEVEW